MSQPQLSACVIAQNESARIERCLRSLQFADELIVLDGGSNDNTMDIARRCGAAVFERSFDNFINQKNHVISLAQGEWVLVVDADEVVSPALAEEVRACLRAPSGRVAFWIPRMSFYLQRWIRHCGWYPEYKLRLFRRGEGQFVGDTVHEGVEFHGPSAKLRAHLEHYSYESISDHLARIHRYSSAIAQQKYDRGRRSSVLWAILKSISKFWITFIYHRGFMDGRAGLVISVLAGYYNFLKYIKLWELAWQTKHGRPPEETQSL